jgi:hypothetical protein
MTLFLESLEEIPVGPCQSQLDTFIENLRTLFRARMYTTDIRHNVGFIGRQPVVFDLSVDAKRPPKVPVVKI